MPNDNKSLPFGLSAMFDPFAHESRSGKSALMSELLAEHAVMQRDAPESDAA